MKPETQKELTTEEFAAIADRIGNAVRDILRPTNIVTVIIMAEPGGSKTMHITNLADQAAVDSLIHFYQLDTKSEVEVEMPEKH